MSELGFRVTGTVRSRETGQPIQGITVRAYDKDLLYDDLLGAVRTDENGYFEIRYEGADFRELFERYPDIYFKVYDEQDNRLLLLSPDSVRWQAGTDEVFGLVVPHYRPSRGVDVVLLDGQGNPRDVFEAGESLVVGVQGFRPERSHWFRLLD